MIQTRQARLTELASSGAWDVVVIGGGASGLGCAVESASRGYRTLLIERMDFAQGTSSRSTKLVHGGVRYLEQMNLPLVLDALRERGHMLANAPHLVHKMGFVVPLYRYPSVPYYGIGLKAYELLSGRHSFGKSQLLSRNETLQRLPTVRTDGLKAGILYRDGQFDDARYAVSLMRTLQDLGGVALNYTEAARLLKRNGRIEGVRVRDAETQQEYDLLARVVINATGAFAQTLLDMDEPGAPALLTLSQGSHFVLPKDFLPSTDALMIPKTDDGRVLFAIPWHGHVLVGTTDEPVAHSSVEPRATNVETNFLSEHIRKYLGRTIASGDVLSMWSGLRPLVRGSSARTAKLSRDHRIAVSASGLVTVTGGKWTTYRKMGEDTVNRAIAYAGLAATPSGTASLKLHGWREAPATEASEHERLYGTDFEALQAMSAAAPALNERLHPSLPYRRRDVLWAARYEHARTVEDVLARRTRALFLNAKAAMAAAETVSHLLAAELGRDESFRLHDLQHFMQVAQGYVYEN